MSKPLLRAFLTLSVMVCFIAVSCDNPEEPQALDPLKIGILLPISADTDTKGSYDGDALAARLVADGYACTCKYSANGIQTELDNITAFAAEGVKVLIYSHVDQVASAASVRIAKDAGMKVLCYDRLARGTDKVDFYINYDNIRIGELMGECLVNAVPTGETGKDLYIYTGDPDDYNSVWFFRGSWSVLQPKIADGTFIVKNSTITDGYKNTVNLSDAQIYEIIGQTTMKWDYDIAQALVEMNLGAVSAIGTVYVLAPNDQAAYAMIPEFKESPHNGTPIITGQDGWTVALNAVIDGTQKMTILKPLVRQFDAAVSVATLFADGKTPTPTDFKTVNNGTADIPALYATPILIDSVQDIRDAIAAGDITATGLNLP